MKRAFWLTVFVGFALGFLFVLSAGCAALPPRLAKSYEAAYAYSGCIRVRQCDYEARKAQCWDRAVAICLEAGFPRDCAVDALLMMDEGPSDRRGPIVCR